MVRTLLAIAVGAGLACAALAETAKTTLTVGRTACAGCAADMRLRLDKLEGVLSSEMRLERGKIEVAYDPAETDAGAIAESMQQGGFPVWLAPWEAVDAMFNGCSNGFCGLRSPNARARVQPGVARGQKAYCPVSGVVLQVKRTTFKREAGGKTFYVCCEGCARYFDAKRERVLALRGLSALAAAPQPEPPK
jgi:copper chaperone